MGFSPEQFHGCQTAITSALYVKIFGLNEKFTSVSVHKLPLDAETDHEPGIEILRCADIVVGESESIAETYRVQIFRTQETGERTDAEMHKGCEVWTVAHGDAVLHHKLSHQWRIMR